MIQHRTTALPMPRSESAGYSAPAQKRHDRSIGVGTLRAILAGAYPLPSPRAAATSAQVMLAWLAQCSY